MLYVAQWADTLECKAYFLRYNHLNKINMYIQVDMDIRFGFLCWLI